MPEGKAADRWPTGLIFICISLVVASTISLGGCSSAGKETVPAPPTATPSPPAISTPAPQPTATTAPTETPTPTALPAEITDALGVAMRLIPAGEFTMGTNGGPDDAKPEHQVYLDAYYIDKFEVTNTLYKACVEAAACAPPQQNQSSTHATYYGDPEFDAYPVISIDWQMANDFCEWRGLALPSEAQWEKAARGADERNFPWGNQGIDCSYANYFDANKGEKGCVGDTAAVGSYEKGQSPYGVYDLAGNVWEWAADWYSEDYYGVSPGSNPQGSETGETRVMRGGAWNLNELHLISTGRGQKDPMDASRTIGFRCVATSP
jgi:formylglycine-generating enzyme required for sulfatase activity